MFASCGWTQARSTLLNILRAAAECIAVFVTHLREVVRAGPILRQSPHQIGLEQASFRGDVVGRPVGPNTP